MKRPIGTTKSEASALERKERTPVKRRKIDTRLGLDINKRAFTLLDAMVAEKDLNLNLYGMGITYYDLTEGMNVEFALSKISAGKSTGKGKRPKISPDTAIETAKIVLAHLKRKPDYYKTVPSDEKSSAKSVQRSPVQRSPAQKPRRGHGSA